MNKNNERKTGKTNKAYCNRKNLPFLYTPLNSVYTPKCKINTTCNIFSKGKIGWVLYPLLAGNKNQLPVNVSASLYLDCALPAAVLHRAAAISHTNCTCCSWHFQHELLLQRAHGPLIIPFSTHKKHGIIQRPVLSPHSQHNLHHTFQGHTCIINTRLM